MWDKLKDLSDDARILFGLLVQYVADKLPRKDR